MTINRTFWLLAAGIFNALALPQPAYAQAQLQKMVNWCIGKNSPTPAQIVQGCTAAINSKKFKGEILASGYQNRASAYGRMNKLDESLKDAQQAVKLAPRAPEAHLMLAEALFKLGQHDEAIAASNVVIAINPKVTLGYYNRGTMYFGMGQPEKALADFDKAISLDPKYGPAYNNRANTKLTLKKYDEAVADATVAIALIKPAEPKANRAVPLGTRADAYKGLKKYDLALKDLNDAIALAPTVQYIGGRMILYEEMGKLELGLPDADRMIEMDPKNAMAWNSRCWIKAVINKLDDALTDCNKGLELAPNNSNLLDSRGLVHLKAGKYDDAITDYNAALKNVGYQDGGKVGGTMAIHLYGRGLAREKKGDMLGSAVDLAQAKTASPDLPDKFESYLKP